MNKIIKIVSSLSFIIVCIAFSISLAHANTIKKISSDSIISNYEKEKVDFDSSIEVELSAFNNFPNISINNNSKKLLLTLGKDVNGERQIKQIYDRILDRAVTRIVTKDSEIDIDINGDIVSYKNLLDYSTVDKYKRNYTEKQVLLKPQYKIDEKSKLLDTIEMFEDIYDLTDYKLVDCSNNIEGVWVLTWCKDYGNGLINSYDCVNVVVDAKDGSIMLCGRNKMLPNTLQPDISEDEAKNVALTIVDNYKKVGVRLTFTRPNFYFEDGGPYNMANFVRLCYEVLVDDSLIIDVDAITGEILGGTEEQGTAARSMVALDESTKGQHKASLAYEAFKRLEYDQTNYGMVYWRINQTDIDWILAREDMYAIYLNCHGDVIEENSHAVLFDSDKYYNSNWFVNCYSYTNFGNWRFVFLDACWTSSTKLWCNAFHCTDAGECFVGWNNAVNKATEYDFVQRFFPRLGTMSVHDAVVTSLWESREAGYNDINGMICNPGFYGDMNYYGWAWR